MARPLSVALLALALVFVASCGEEEESDKPAPRPASTEKSRGGCRSVERPAPKPDGGARKPKRKLDQSKDYSVTLATNCGSMTIELDLEASPDTAASFVALARKGFFDDTVFHRIVPGFVIQGGDPTGSGSGGPGYSTVDEPPPDTTYTRGVVAMAKTAQEPPGTAGSQFYVVTGDAVQLPPEYALLGEVTKGLDVAERIGRLGDPQSGDAGTPLEPVVIESTRVDASS